MKSITHPAKTIVAACMTALALAACGGSDSGGTSGAASGASTGFSGQDASAPVLTNNVANDGFNWINYRRAQAASARWHATTCSTVRRRPTRTTSA